MRLHPLQFITSICYPSLGEEPTQLHCTCRISFHLLTSQSVKLKESLRSFTLSSSLIDKVQLPLRPLPRFDHLCSPSFNISIHLSIHGYPEPNLVPLYNCCRDPNPKCAVFSVTFKHLAAIETFLITCPLPGSCHVTSKHMLTDRSGHRFRVHSNVSLGELQ